MRAGRILSPDTACGVIVLGMHRSGTSAVTRVVNLLGVPLGRADDIYSAPDNPSGHWESMDLCRVNDTILRVFDGFDMAPPSFSEDWVSTRRADRMTPGMVSVFRSVYTSDRWVWKDPRLCLTLPLWRRLLSRLCVVFVLRDPVPVASSLKRRDGYPEIYGRALWDYYTRSALAAMRGLPVAIVSYEELTAEPITSIRALYESLSSFGLEVDGANISEAARSIRTTVNSKACSRHAGSAQSLLYSQLSSMDRGQDCFDLPDPRVLRGPAWVKPLLAAGRLRIRLDEYSEPPPLAPPALPPASCHDEMDAVQ